MSHNGHDPVEHVDVLIVGAGLSGIGAAHHLRERSPGRSFAVLEAREAIGGTWDLFRYPGIRSDSDMHTLGYAFRPWTDAQSLADGPSILRYIRDTAREDGTDQQIRFGHRVERASWSSEEARWTVQARRTGDDTLVTISCGFLFMCSGYYRYDEGYVPDFPGRERFTGPVVHPQQWTDDVDYAGKRVVVIGSGATAVTLVPALARAAAHVTMLQRSPTYIVAVPAQDPIALALRRVLPEKLVYHVVRLKNVLLTMLVFQLSRRRPKLVRRLVRKGVERELPGEPGLDTDFEPRYDPWDQRMCVVPEGDLFEAIRERRASVVTGRIASFTETGLALESGEQLEADLIVTATGLQMLALGGIELEVDGDELRLPDTLGYKGMMLSGVPNMAMAMGYTNASWTLKCDLTCEFVCKLLNHMAEHGYASAAPPSRDPALPTQPFVDLKSGYVQRSIDQFPRQGLDTPWRLHQNYLRDIAILRLGALEDGVLEFEQRRTSRATAGSPAPTV